MRGSTSLPIVALTAVLVTGAAVAPPPQAAAVRKPVSFAVLEDYDKGADLDDVARDFALMRRLGVTTWRGSLGWDDYEPRRGEYDFAWLEQFLARAAREGITLRPYVGYTPAWAARRGADADAWNDPPADLEDWDRFLARLTALLRRHPHVASLEIYNEQNVPLWWDGTRDDFTALLTRSLGGVRDGGRRLPLFAGGLVFPDVAWIEDVCGALGPDRRPAVVAVHAYPETWTPADVTAEAYLGPGFDAFVAASDRHCGRRPIWINETGFATVPGRSEQEQADWWVRAMATFLATPRVEHLGIYEIKDLPADRPVIGDAPNHHLGLTRTDRSPKLAFHTVDLLTDLLDTGTLDVRDADLAVGGTGGAAPAGVYAHLFRRPDGRRVAIAWTRTMPITVELGVRTAAASVTSYALDGRGVPLLHDGGAVLRDVRLVPGTPRIFLLQ